MRAARPGSSPLLFPSLADLPAAGEAPAAWLCLPDADVRQRCWFVLGERQQERTLGDKRRRGRMAAADDRKFV